MRSVHCLTALQKDVLAAVASSKSRTQIARERGLHLNTVDFHLAKIARRLQLNPNLDPRVTMTLRACRERLVRV